MQGVTGDQALCWSTLPLERIADLLCPVVATTNYDDLLEQLQLAHFDTATWNNPLALLHLRQRGRTVLHLHGFYRDPPSVIIGLDNYATLVEDDAYRVVLQSLWIDRILFFIGCSFDGLQDPDFTRMLAWFAQTFWRGAPPLRFHAGGFLYARAADALAADQQRSGHSVRTNFDSLPDAISAINVNQDRAYARRMLLSKRLLETHTPAGERRFVTVLSGATGGAESSPGLVAAARALWAETLTSALTDRSIWAGPCSGYERRVQ